MRIVKISLTGVSIILLALIIGRHDVFAGQSNKDNERLEQQYRDLEKPQGALYKIAKKSGEKHTTIAFLPDRSVIAPNLRQLSRRSTDVIIGRVLANYSQLNSAKDEVQKFLTVFVQMVYKGTVVNAGQITIKTLGGSWLYSDGVSLTWMPVGETSPLDGKSYIFFLTKDGDGNYIPSLGAQGVFEMDFEIGVIVPIDMNKRDPVVAKYANAPLQEFMDEITSVIAEEVHEF